MSSIIFVKQAATAVEEQNNSKWNKPNLADISNNCFISQMNFYFEFLVDILSPSIKMKLPLKSETLNFFAHKQTYKFIKLFPPQYMKEFWFFL